MLALSIVIPTYNRCDSLRDLLAGLAPQLTDREEVLVVDDGSRDNTLERLRPLFPQVQWIQTERQGPGRARNAGLRQARGRYMWPLDSDWLLLPDSLARLREHLAQRREELLFFPCRSIPKGRVSTVVPCPTAVSADDLLCERVRELVPVVSLEALRRLGLEYPNYAMGGEMFLWVRFCQLSQALLIPDVLTLYRTDTADRISTAETQIAYADSMAAIAEDWLVQLEGCRAPDGPQQREKKRLAAAVYRILAGEGALGRAHLRVARRPLASLLWALSWSPGMARVLYRFYRRGQKQWHGEGA